MIKSTNTVIIATVITRFVAILYRTLVHYDSQALLSVNGAYYLRAIPLSVFTLLST